MVEAAPSGGGRYMDEHLESAYGYLSELRTARMALMSDRPADPSDGLDKLDWCGETNVETYLQSISSPAGGKSAVSSLREAVESVKKAHHTGAARWRGDTREVFDEVMENLIANIEAQEDQLEEMEKGMTGGDPKQRANITGILDKIMEGVEEKAKDVSASAHDSAVLLPTLSEHDPRSPKAEADVRTALEDMNTHVAAQFPKIAAMQGETLKNVTGDLLFRPYHQS